jgi:hypothetical protein
MLRHKLERKWIEMDGEEEREDKKRSHKTRKPKNLITLTIWDSV